MGAADLPRLVGSASRELPRKLLVRGDLINVSRGTRHMFVGLRDGSVVVPVFVHAEVLARLPAVPSEGTAVVVRASPSWYRPRWDFQLVVRDLWIADERRARREAVARLRGEFEARGLLRANRRLALPRLPAAIAVVGGRRSAAVLDMVKAVHRRSPRTGIRIHPTRLRGPGAAEEIANAIRGASASGGEAVAVVRGGGGVDDLSPFVTREVCEAIATSLIPDVTALGHEQDRTLADLAAHSSASTPTDAARFLVADVVDLTREMIAARRRLFLALRTTNIQLTEAGRGRRQRLTSAAEAPTP